jgi:hypothetical protein
MSVEGGIDNTPVSIFGHFLLNPFGGGQSLQSDVISFH